MSFPLILCLALLLDILLGDPHGLPHPVAGIGRLIAFLEHFLYPTRGERAFLRGGLLCGATLLLTGAAVGLLLWAVSPVPWLLGAVEVYLLYAALAWRSLKDETLPVALALFRRDLPGARDALSRVVGRHPVRDVLRGAGPRPFWRRCGHGAVRLAFQGGQYAGLDGGL